ncbi:MAG: anti-sigma factor [Ilumatobacteraceae bacterium]
MNPRIDDLIAMAALGELTDNEAAELDAATSDSEVAAELEAALSAAAALQASAREVPRTTLRASVLGAITGVHQDVAPAAPNVVSIDRARSRRFAPLAAAAAVLLFVAGAVVVASNNDSRSTDSVAAVLDADDASTRPFSGSLGDSLVAAYSPTEAALVISGAAVVAPDVDETYQLWLIDDSGATSVGVFRPDRSGAVSVRFGNTDPSDFSLGVTLEPSGGSLQPTMPILATA